MLTVLQWFFWWKMLLYSVLFHVSSTVVESVLFSSWLLCLRVSRVVLYFSTASSIKRGSGLCGVSIRAAVMAFEWRSSLESTRPPDISSRFQVMDARREFASNKNTCYLPSRQPCFLLLIHPGHLVLGWLEVEAVSEAFAVWWCRTRGGCYGGFPLNGIFGDGIVFVAKIYPREEEMPPNDARRGFAMCLIFHLFLLTSLSSLDIFNLFPTGNNKICNSLSVLGLKSLCCSQVRVDSSTLITQICISFSLGM